jgi:pimeloyl-ACP methyl ester carboxylesterase
VSRPISAACPRFTKPVTLVWGQRDHCFTLGLGRWLAGWFSNEKSVEVPDAKTFVALDQPDVVIDAIAAMNAERA